MEKDQHENGNFEQVSLRDLLMLLPEEMSLEELLALLPEGVSQQELAGWLPGDGMGGAGMFEVLAERKRRRLQLEAKINGVVRQYGYSIMGVVDPTSPGAAFAYTIGLHHTNQALSEVVMTGLDIPRLRGFLAHMAESMLTGTSFQVGQTYTGLVEGGYPLFLAAVEEGYYEQYLGWAINYYARQPFPAVQLVLPDDASRFSWQRGYDERSRNLQPLLFDPEQYAHDASDVNRGA